MTPKTANTKLPPTWPTILPASLFYLPLIPSLPPSLLPSLLLSLPRFLFLSCIYFPLSSESPIVYYLSTLCYLYLCLFILSSFSSIYPFCLIPLQLYNVNLSILSLSDVSLSLFPLSSPCFPSLPSLYLPHCVPHVNLVAASSLNCGSKFTSQSSSSPHCHSQQSISKSICRKLSVARVLLPITSPITTHNTL